MPDIPGENTINTNDDGGGNEWVESMKDVEKEPAKQFCEKELKGFTVRYLLLEKKGGNIPDKEEFVNEKLKYAKELVESVVGDCMHKVKGPWDNSPKEESRVEKRMGRDYNGFIDCMFIVGCHKKLASEHPDYTEEDFRVQGLPAWAAKSYDPRHDLSNPTVREYVLGGLKEFVGHAKETIEESYEGSYREEIEAKNKELALGESVLEAMSGWFDEPTPEE